LKSSGWSDLLDQAATVFSPSAAANHCSADAHLSTGRSVSFNCAIRAAGSPTAARSRRHAAAAGRCRSGPTPGQGFPFAAFAYRPGHRAIPLERDDVCQSHGRDSSCPVFIPHRVSPPMHWYRTRHEINPASRFDGSARRRWHQAFRRYRDAPAHIFPGDSHARHNCLSRQRDVLPAPQGMRPATSSSAKVYSMGFLGGSGGAGAASPAVRSRRSPRSSTRAGSSRTSAWSPRERHGAGITA